MRIRFRSSGGAAFPEGLRDHAEHRAAIEIEKPVGDGHDFEITERERLWPFGFRPFPLRLFQLHENALSA
jgi:hypothetical protein